MYEKIIASLTSKLARQRESVKLTEQQLDVYRKLEADQGDLLKKPGAK